MPTITKVSEAHEIDTKGKVTVFYKPNFIPKTKIEGVNYVKLSGNQPIRDEVSQLVGGLADKVKIYPSVRPNGNYTPNRISVTDEIIALTVMSERDALELLGRKRLTIRARDLAGSILWGVSSKSYM